LIDNLQDDAIAGGVLTAIPMRFEDAVAKYVLPADLLVVGVDRNDCRRAAVQLARRCRIPAIFTMLSGDGLRCQSFLQGPDPGDACLWCALPNLNPDHQLPCAAVVIASCLLASAFTLFFGYRALMGWPQGVSRFNFREANLMAATPDRIGFVAQRTGCNVCGRL